MSNVAPDSDAPDSDAPARVDRSWTGRRRMLLGAGAMVLAALAVLLLTRDRLPEPDATILLQEYAIAVPTELPAGENVFLVRNIGHAHHNLTVCPLDEASGRCAAEPEFYDMLRRPEEARDQSFFKDRADMLVIGKRWDTLIRYDLEPGTYRFFCGIVGHAPNGMQRTVTVE